MNDAGGGCAYCADGAFVNATCCGGGRFAYEVGTGVNGAGGG